MKLALLTNIIAPYRIPVYKILSGKFDIRVFITGKEDNRLEWLDIGIPVQGLIRNVRGFTLKRKVKSDNGVYDYKYLHLPFGCFSELRKFSPDAIISNEMGMRSILAILYGKFHKKPVWIWWGGTLHTEKSTGGLRRLIRYVFARMPIHWISYGESSTEYLVKIGVNRDSILQIQNSIDETKFIDVTCKYISRPEIKPAFLYVGQLIDRKGIPQLISAFAGLQKEGLKFSVYLAGDGPQRFAYEKYALALNMQDLHFLGIKSQADLLSIYRSMDYFIFPTLEDVWGLVLNEAIWSDLPVIASIYAGATQEVIPEEYRFDPLCKTEFAEILRKAIQGKVYPINKEKLLTSKEVADKIINRIIRELKE